MPTYSLAEILTVEERDEVLATLLAVAAALDAPTTSWQEGAPILTLLTTASQKFADLTAVAVEIAKGGFGDLLPSDAWADLWAQSRFNETRVQATEATVDITITSDADAASDTYDPGEIIIAHATTDKIYRNTAAITIAPSSVLTDQPFAADEPGIASNAAPGAITVVVSSLVGVTVTNPEAALGTDKETTAALVVRCRAKLASFSPNGPKDAYDYVATSPTLSATSTPITRTNTVLTTATGALSVYLATSAGAPDAADVAIVQAAIDDNVEPWGTTATAIAASEHLVPVTYHVWVRDSQLTSAQIQTAIGDALATWFSTFDLGGYVVAPDTGAIYVEALQQVIGTAVPGVVRVTVSAPASTVVLTPLEVAVLSTITPTVTLL